MIEEVPDGQGTDSRPRGGKEATQRIVQAQPALVGEALDRARREMLGDRRDRVRGVGGGRDAGLQVGVAIALREDRVPVLENRDRQTRDRPARKRLGGQRVDRGDESRVIPRR